MHKNILTVVGITILILGLAIAPVITADDNDTDDADDVSIDNSNEIGASDEYEEIITYINGNSEITWIKKRGLLRGEAELKSGTHDWLHLMGIRRSNRGWEIYFEDDVEYVYAPRFIGIQGFTIYYVVWGIAMGNIEWEK